MRRALRYVDIRVGQAEDIRRVAVLSRYRYEGEDVIYVMNASRFEIYNVVKKEDGFYAVRELRSVLDWEALVNALRRSCGQPAIDLLGVVTTDHPAATLRRVAVVRMDGREFFIYMNAMAEPGKARLMLVAECWMDNGFPMREATEDEELVYEVFARSSLAVDGTFLILVGDEEDGERNDFSVC